jgi:exonuclease SbcD
MRLAHAADIHLGHKQYGRKRRENDVKRSFQHFLKKAREHDVTAIILPGDLFDSRNVSPQTLQQAEDLLEDVAVPVIVSPGNHDENMSTRRDLTWLQYLNDRDLITLLSADLNGEVLFTPTDTDNQRQGGGGYVDLDADGETVRCFGLQYRGAYIEQDLSSVAEGIRAVNEREGDPDATVLLAHFGIDDAVPDLGANVARAKLTDIEGIVDYLALGHIHKQYESEVGWNPGSLEALDIQEGRWEEHHGYYILDTETGEADHHLSKRRPYYTLNFDVSGYHTFEDLRSDFTAAVEDEREQIEEVCEREIHRASGRRREPIVNVRFEGTLLLDHATFDVETLCAVAEDRLDALHVQPTDSTERKAIQELLGDLERNEAFNSDGTVNTDALQERVFTTIAEESRYSAEADAVATTLDDLEGLVSEDEQGTGEIATYLRDRRRELFPDGPAEDGAGGGNDANDEQHAGQQTLDAEVTSE